MLDVAQPPFPNGSGLDPAELEAVRRLFIAEAEEGLGVAESGLLRLEQQPDDPDVIAPVFRAVHTLKGNSGAFGLTAVGALAHALEDALGDLRDRVVAPSPERISLMLAAVDELRGLLAQGSAAPRELSGPHEDLRRRLASSRGTTPMQSKPAAGRPSAGGEGAGASAALARTLRVSIERLDQLLSLTGEIAVARARLSQMIETPSLPRRRLQEAQRESERLYIDLQDLVMKLRMVPVGPALAQLARTVRDLALALGKEARFEIAGGDVEVDNAVLQLLRDPLTHMVRNAIDHGIEKPERRVALGKPRAGLVAIRCVRQPGAILIELADDGAGIERARLLAKARERGLLAPDAVPPDAQLFGLLFEAGFSTVDEVSDLSGRGVGLDVVRRNIHALRGTVGITSQSGQGTTVTIRLPLTLAVIEGLLVRLGETTGVLPVEEVTESLAMPAEASSGAGRGVVMLRGKALPYVRLRHLFGVAGAPPPREVLIVVASDTGPVGFVVDAVSGQRQTVIKPLAKVFRNVPGISATTVLGDGQVALILDVAALIEAVAPAGGEGTTAAAGA